MSAARCVAIGVAVGAWLFAPASVASRPTMQECFEASDFIGNAALSRDAGIAPDAFLGRMESDFVAIRVFPNELRWFVHDAQDEAFLLGSAREVFEHPAAPEEHRSAFLRSCIERMAGEVEADSGLAPDVSGTEPATGSRSESPPRALTPLRACPPQDASWCVRPATSAPAR